MRNNHGWGLGVMLICLAGVGFCLIVSALLVGKLDASSSMSLVSGTNKSIRNASNDYLDISNK